MPEFEERVVPDDVRFGTSKDGRPSSFLLAYRRIDRFLA